MVGGAASLGFLQLVGRATEGLLGVFGGGLSRILEVVGPLAGQVFGEKIQARLQRDPGYERLQILHRSHILDGLAFDADVGFFVACLVFFARKSQLTNGDTVAASASVAFAASASAPVPAAS